MEQAGVVTVIGLIKEFLQACIGICAVAEAAQRAVVFNASIFGNA
jgi:hypothetical protein